MLGSTCNSTWVTGSLSGGRKLARCLRTAPPQEQHRGRACKATSQLTGLSEGLQKLDAALGRGDGQGEAEALKTLDELKSGGLVKAFGTGQQVPKRAYTLEELRLNKIEPEKFLSPEDKTLNQIRTILQVSAVVGLLSLSAAFHLEANQTLGTVVFFLFLLTGDQVANGGGFEALAIDYAGRLINKEYAERVSSHEAGHFLVAYLIGLLPKKYIISSVDAFKRYGALNIQAGTSFCDLDFQKEMASGKMSSSTLDTYCCIALSGVATEYILYGRSEGGLNDVQQLDALLKALQFTQAKSNSQVRWAVLNVVSILKQHKRTLRELSLAMADGKSIGECIAVIEKCEQ